MILADIYKLPPIQNDGFADVFRLFGCYYNFMPELEIYDLNLNSFPKDAPLQFVIHGLYDEHDGRRFWMIWSAWFDNKPFMIMRNAGREGDGFHSRHVTDNELYNKAVKYLRTFSKSPELNPEVFVDANTEIADFTSFYGKTLEEAYTQNKPLKVENK